MNAKTETNIKLPLAFIFFSLVAFIASQWVLLQQAETFANGIYRTPTLWMAAHFLLLGWAVMVVMGAMYQLVPVAFLTPIWNEKFGFMQFGVTALGIFSFALLLGFKPQVAMHAGGIAVLGILMFLFQMFMTIKQQEKTNEMTLFVGGALLSLAITILAGFILAWNISIGSYLNHMAILKSHLLFGLTGWFTLLIFGFSYKMVPMFSLSHGFSMKWAKPAFGTYILGMILLLSSFWMDITFTTILGWLLLWLAFTFFGLDIKEILQKRIKKKLDRPFLFSIIAIIFGWLIHGGAFGLSIFAPDNQKLWGLIIYFYLMMWIIFSILGYLYKIVPFLWWTHKYSSQMGQKNVPTLKEMMNEKLAVVLFGCFIIGTIGLAVASLLIIPIAATIFQAILLVTAIAYSTTIIRVITK